MMEERVTVIKAQRPGREISNTKNIARNRERWGKKLGGSGKPAAEVASSSDGYCWDGNPLKGKSRRNQPRMPT